MSIYPHSFQIIISQSWVYQEKFFYSFFLPYASITRRMHAKHVRTHARTYACIYVLRHNYARAIVKLLFI